jgi:hypothetical protein
MVITINSGHVLSTTTVCRAIYMSCVSDELTVMPCSIALAWGVVPRRVKAFTLTPMKFYDVS